MSGATPEPELVRFYGWCYYELFIYNPETRKAKYAKEYYWKRIWRLVTRRPLKMTETLYKGETR